MTEMSQGTRLVIEQARKEILPELERRALLYALGHSPDCVAPDHYRKVWQAERDRMLAQGAMVEVIAEERDRLKVELADARRRISNQEQALKLRRHIVAHLREDRDRWQAEAQRACEIAEDAVERADNAQRVPDEHEGAYWKSAAAHAYDEITKLARRAERAEHALRLAPAYACELIPEKVAFTEPPQPCGECDVCLFHAARDEALAEAPTGDPPAAEPDNAGDCPGEDLRAYAASLQGGQGLDVGDYLDPSDPTRLAPEPNMCGWCGHFHTGRCLPYREAHGDRRPMYSRSGMDVIVPNVEDGGVLGDLVTCGQCGGSGELHDPHELPEPVEPQGEDSPLVAHAEREMRLAGLYDTDADYDGMIPQAVMAVVRAFAAQGHSGASAGMTLAIIDKVLRWEPLTALTSDPDEWQDVSEISGRPFWQSRRDPTVFSEDGGQTWYRLGDDAVHTSQLPRQGPESVR